MNINDRTIRIARDLRVLIQEGGDKARLNDLEQLALALVPLLDELSEAGLIGPDVGLELNEYARLKSSGASVAEQYGDSFDLGLKNYKSNEHDDGREEVR